ncbi:MAG: inorganic phosphate transporter [Elusimicrobiota bacterium]
MELLTGLVLLFSFLNGANDSGTMAASVVSSRTLSPRQSVVLAAAASFLGAVLLGSEVARTLGVGLIRPDRVIAAESFAACPAAAGAAILWSLLVWRLALPGSYTHALLGGWLGGFTAVSGFGAVHWDQAGWILLAVLLTPLAGLAAAWIAIRLLLRYGSELSMHAMPLFRALQILLFGGLCFAHGANVAQKGMALLVAGGYLAAGLDIPEAFSIPVWVRLSCSAAFSLGVLAGFSRVLKTVGFGIFKVDVLHSLCAIGSAGGLVLASTAAGMPLSPGQINSSALLGAGAGENARTVRWSVAGDLLLSWVMTFPACAVLAFLLAHVLKMAG